MSIIREKEKQIESMFAQAEKYKDEQLFLDALEMETQLELMILDYNHGV